jgi:signal transduction histidine kinase
MLSSKAEAEAAIVDARARLEEALEHLAQLPAFDPRSAGVAAHALNNYLTVTAATLEFLRLSLQNHPDPQIARYLLNLEHATDLMEHTVAQLMGISTSGPPTLMRQQVDLPRLIERACLYYQRLADQKQIRLTCEAAITPRTVRTDPVALAAILDNLLSNAVKYSTPGKRVWVQVERLPDRVICRVRDEGPGLSQEDQARLFQAGVRLSAVPTAGEPSTGYGLAVAKELASQLGGDIWCESQLGQGACFAVSLPV